jgi:hypothetical protein
VVVTALQAAASCLGGTELDLVINAATWAFCGLDAAVRQWVVDDFWYRGVAKLEASEAERTRTTCTEKVYALAANCSAALRRRVFHHDAG